MFQASKGGESQCLPFFREQVENTIPARWSEIVAHFPHYQALRGEPQNYTFRELDRQARSLASRLEEAAPEPRGCVALLTAQNTNMVTGALAVLLAGKAVLGLHPGQPVEALRQTLDDARPQVLFSEPELVAQAEAAAGGQYPVLSMGPAEGSPVLRADDLQAGDPATILYTSGSSGLPKGVVKSHRSILHRVWLGQEHDQISPSDRASLLTHVSFASAEADIFATLLLGGCVCVFDVAGQGLGPLRRWLKSEKITLFHPPVVLFRQFLRTLDPSEQFSGVRLVSLAGDVVVPRDLVLWKKYFSAECELRHRFSSTETALITVAHFKAPQASLHCGKPVPDKEVEIRNPDSEGVGEIVVRSPFLADGYWNRPQETEQAFESDSQGRLYRTGDLGRWDQEGNLHFVGRRDDQIKIRGFRLSCREVESALLQLEEVAEAAVTASRSSGETELEAWVCLNPGHEPCPSRLHLRLSEYLPEWKIPARFSFGNLPKTLTGKVDKPALKKRGQEDLGIVRQLEQIWLSLDRRPVSADDDLLLHGGDSITIVLLLHEIEQKLGVEITPREFFAKRTLGHLADLVAGNLPSREAIVPVEIPIREPLVSSVSDGFLHLLNEFGIEYLFVNPGTDSAPLLESIIKFSSRQEKTPKVVLCLHESVALGCAHGSFMVTGKAQMVFVHVDLGTLNVGGNLHNAQRGRAGVVLVAGRSPYTLEGSKASRDRYAHWIQEQRDQAGVVRNYVRWDYTLPTPENLAPALEKAFQMATSSPPAPVYLTLPREVLMAELKDPPRRGRSTLRSRKAPDLDLVDRVTTLLLESRFPLLLTSRSGSEPQAVEALVEICERIALPVVETRHRLNFPHTHPLHLGFSPNQFLGQADLVLILDHEVPWIPEQWSPGKDCRIVQVDPDTAKADIPLWGFPIDLAIEAEALPFLQNLAATLDRRLTKHHDSVFQARREAHAQTHRQLRERWAEAAQERREERPIAPPWFAYCLNQVVDKRTLLVCDAATNNPVVWTYLAMDLPGTFYQSQGSSLGWGLGAALGAKLASPDSLVIAVVGDGGWMFSNPLAVYEAMRQQEAPFLTIVLNNEKYAAISEAVQSLAPDGEARRRQEFPACNLPAPGYYSRIAKAAGLWSVTVREPSELLASLRQAARRLERGEAGLVEVWTSSPNP